MGQACIKGPQSAGAQEPSSGIKKETSTSTTAKQLEVEIPEGLDSATLPEAKESYGSEHIHAPHRNGHPADGLDPISITATATGHTSSTASAAQPAVTSGSSDSLLAEQSGSKLVSDDSNYSDADADTSTTSNVELLRNYAQLAELLHFSPYPLLLIDIEVEAQPIVFASQVLQVNSGNPREKRQILRRAKTSPGRDTC